VLGSSLLPAVVSSGWLGSEEDPSFAVPVVDPAGD